MAEFSLVNKTKCSLLQKDGGGRKNLEELRKQVKNTAGSWRSGRFNPLVSTHISLNSYYLNKFLFPTSSVNLRVSNINFFNAKSKSCHFQDMLQKPFELMLFRLVEQGSLGLHNVSCKTTANLISTYLQLAANLSYSPS